MKAQLSWLSLVTFCAVTVLIAALGSAALFAGASVGLAVGPANEETNASAEESILSPALEQRAGVQTAARGAAVSQTVDDSGAVTGQTFSGMITDSHCGAKHQRNSGKTAAECARSCVGNGAKYVLVDGEKIYALEGAPGELAKLAGERVSIVGMLEGSTIRVKAVVPG